jgi:copper chaperone CopZ
MIWSRKEIEEQTFLVEGMRCTNCESSVKIALHKVPGVRKIKIHQRKRVMVETLSEKQVSRAKLIAAIERTGYKVDTESNV